MGKLAFWSELRNGEWLLKSYYPTSVNQPQEWTIYVYCGEDVVRQAKVPMDYAPRFGPDGADIALLNESLAAMLKELVDGSN